MDLVLKSFQKENLFNFLRTFSIPIGIMVLIAMMVIPLSPTMLDILFTSNLLVSLLVLMVALQTFRPLDFSSFPTVLVICHCFETWTKCRFNQSNFKKWS